MESAIIIVLLLIIAICSAIIAWSQNQMSTALMLQASAMNSNSDVLLAIIDAVHKIERKVDGREETQS